MKKILACLLAFVIFNTNVYPQTMYKKYEVVAIDTSLNVPRYLIGENDDKKDTLGIVITMNQARKIDNDYDLLQLYRSVHNDCDSTVGFLVQVVKNYKNLDILAQEKFTVYDITVRDQKSQIDNLKSQIDVKKELILSKDLIIAKKDTLIDLNKLQIKHIKKQRNIAYVVSGVVGSALLYEIFKK